MEMPYQKDKLSESVIRSHLTPMCSGVEIVICPLTDSTNKEVKRRAREKADEGLLVLAEEQSEGRGRKGRQFVSPPGTGIYLSVLFRPDRKQGADIVRITTAASVAVCRAIEEVLQEHPTIKWVNDIYLQDKKVGGILVEAVSGREGIDTVVVGIGINYRQPSEGFPEQLREIAGALCASDITVSRNVLIASVVNHLFAVYQDLSQGTYMSEYRRLSNVLGRKVHYTSGEKWIQATAIQIEADGGLVVRREDGKEETLRTGEITLRVCQ